MLEAENGKAVADAHAKRSNVVSNLHGADEIEGTGAAILQAKFLARVQTFLASRGCVTGGWEEAAHGNVIDKAKSYLVGWRNVEGSRRLAAEGLRHRRQPRPGLLSRHVAVGRFHRTGRRLGGMVGTQRDL